MERDYENDIAIIGMAGRFPKANDIDAFWKNLTEGVSTVEKADEEKLLIAGISNEVINHKRFVNASSKLEDARFFDADFFGLSNTEATLMDPQIRMLLQTSWHALEDAGYALNNLETSIGNFCGMSMNTYLMKILRTNPQTESVDPLLYRILNDKDFLATWISYKLNLTGPAMTVQTACSTSLLAVHLACQSLLNQECSMALVGGVSYDSEENVGYIHVPESIYAKDGICRPFDKDASGTLMGDGVGAIILKRAEDAIKDQDQIYALIKGTAANNDGGDKQGYTTPSVNYQRDVVLEALAVSDIQPETIGLVEAHGTGTLIGDPIEVAAITEAYREYTDQKQYCAIGSIKSNIGHLDAAAGIAAMIKTVLCVNKSVLVPSINFSTPNPSLQLSTSPFYVSQNHKKWPANFDLRRAGITSLGVGGTNVHVILEQPPEVNLLESVERPFVVALSGMNEKSLQGQKKDWGRYIKNNPEVRLEDIEFTSLYGRKVMTHRFSAVCNSKEELIAQLNGSVNENCFEGFGEIAQSVFMFPGQGSQYLKMAADLYAYKKTFKQDMDYCFDHVKNNYQLDIKEIIFSDDSALLNKTENTQIALFIVEYCLAQELIRSGLKPDALVGHSLGEYVSACMVGCVSLEDGLKLVFHRGRLMGRMPEGEMILVRKDEDTLRPLLLTNASICAYNAPGILVIGGTAEVIKQQLEVFDSKNIKYRKLTVSHAYHTSMMEQVLEEFSKVLAEVEFHDFKDKVFSTYTGELVDAPVLRTPQYWLDQIINPVKFSDAAESIGNYLSNPVFIEVGPGNGLSYFIKKIFNQKAATINLLPGASNQKTGIQPFYEGRAQCFAKGLLHDLPEFQEGKRISLPGYVFTRKNFWKPKMDLQYNDFSEIKQSYHYKNDQYAKDLLRSTVEIKIANKDQISGTQLAALDSLHQQYLSAIKALFPAQKEGIKDRVEMLVDDAKLYNSEDILTNSSESNKRIISSVFVAPETECEQKIATYWGNILGYEPVGVLDNYFEVGGNSLLATKLMTLLADEFEVELSFKELSECLTIKKLAVLISSKLEMLELIEGMEVEQGQGKNFIEL